MASAQAPIAADWWQWQAFGLTVAIALDEFQEGHLGHAPHFHFPVVGGKPLTLPNLSSRAVLADDGIPEVVGAIPVVKGKVTDPLKVG